MRLSVRAATARTTSFLQRTAVEHGQTTLAVEPSDLPVAANPDIAELVGTADLVGILDGDKLTNERLPEVQTILGRVEFRVPGGETSDVVGHTEDTAGVEGGEVLSGRGESVNANDKRGDLVARRHDDDVGGGADLGQVGVQGVAPANWSA